MKNTRTSPRALQWQLSAATIMTTIALAMAVFVASPASADRPVYGATVTSVDRNDLTTTGVNGRQFGFMSLADYNTAARAANEPTITSLTSRYRVGSTLTVTTLECDTTDYCRIAPAF